MSATTSYSLTSTAFDASSTSFSLPPRPPPPPFDDDDDDSSDDESDFGDDDHHHEEEHHSSRPHSLTSDTVSSVQTSTVPNIRASTTFATSTTTSILEVNPTISTASPAKTAQSFDAGNIDSIPQNEADPAIESRIMSSPLGTAGIVLVAIFGFVALLTTFYLFFRLKRRRHGFEGNVEKGLQKSNTSDSTVSLEKGLPSNWASTTQETGIIFGRRSAASSRRPRAEPRGRGRFSFLNRRWYSTGTEATAAQVQYNSSPPPSPPRWGASLFGLGFRSQSATPRSQSVSTSVLEAPYTSRAPDTVDIYSSEIQRNFSQRSGESGEGHARAYAHHNVRAPRSVARSTVSSISSRLLRRRDRGQDRTLPPTPTRSVSETSDMYGGSRRVSGGSERQIRSDRESWAVPPRIPLRVAVSDHRRVTRQSL